MTEERQPSPPGGGARLCSSIVHSTIWREPLHIRVVWITMLAIANDDGCVHASLPGLADVARVTLEQCQEAIERLSAPDPWSRSPLHGGRRIVATDYGWLLLNYSTYNTEDSHERRRKQVRQAVRRHRAENGIAKKTDYIDYDGLQMITCDYTSEGSQLQRYYPPIICKPECPTIDGSTVVSTVKEKTLKAQTPVPYSEAFSEWFLFYGRLTGRRTTKKQAFAEWERLEKRSPDEARSMMELTRAWWERRSRFAARGGFVPIPQDPVRFIKNRRWEDVWEDEEEDIVVAMHRRAGTEDQR